MTISISASVITRNRCQSLARCIGSIFKQEFSEPYEIIIIDDNSTDDTERVVASLKSQAPPNVSLTYIRHEEHGGLCAGRNAAIRFSSAEVVAFTDDDCIARPDWLNTLARYHQKYPGVAAVGGHVANGCRDSIVAEIGQQLISQNIINYTQADGTTCFLVGNNSSYKRKIIEEIGYWDEKLKYGGEDNNIQGKIIAAGYKMLYAPSAEIVHFQRSTVSSMFKQYYKYGVGKDFHLSQGFFERMQYTAMVENSLQRKVKNFLKRPFRTTRYFDKWHQKAAAIGLIYLAGLARGMGFVKARYLSKL